MSAAPPRTPAACFAAILNWLLRAVDTQRAVGRLATPTMVLIITRIIGIRQRFARLAARIGAGTYVPRPVAARRRGGERNPRRANPLPQNFGWLLRLAPEVAGYRAQFEHLLRDPDMLALMAAAPASMARVLRPLCWMLFIKPPPVLARPRTGTLPTETPTPAADPPLQRADPAPPRRPAGPSGLAPLRGPPPPQTA